MTRTTTTTMTTAPDDGAEVVGVGRQRIVG
jgi:hypothetical protein